jgi:acylphosphatase
MEDSDFTVQTITTPLWETGSHPLNGARQFGFENNDDGTVTIYTRGADQAGIQDFIDWAGTPMQIDTWRSFMKGISDEINRLGGHSDFSTFQYWITKISPMLNPANYKCPDEDKIQGSITPSPSNEFKGCRPGWGRLPDGTCELPAWPVG